MSGNARKRLRKKKKKKNKREVLVLADRISDLPDCIIHHILSYIDMKQVVQTCILSQRWRYIWTTTPYMNFSYDESLSHNKSFDDFEFFVDQVLLLRDNDCNIQQFSVHCNIIWYNLFNRKFYKFNINDILDEWLDMALEGNVEIVEKLHIHVSCFESTISCSIKSLNLQKLELPNGNDDKEFILSCPVLEVLILHDCDYRHLRSFTISCSSLKRLDMNSLQSLSGNTVSCSLNICSPNLTSFAYKSWKFKDIAICNLSALISAHVHVQRDSHARHDDVQYLNEILKGISNVKSLSISSEVLKTITDSSKILKMHPKLFHNVRHFLLEECCTHSTYAFAHIIKRLPYLEDFVWKRDKWFWESTKYEEHMGKDLPVVLSKFCYLKTVKVQNSFGTEDELKFFKFILERATMLKEMSIVTRKMDKKRMTKFKLKLFALKRISPGVLIHCRVGA